MEPLVAAVLWGGVFAAAKLGMREIPVLAFTSLRLLVATVLLVAVSGGLGRGWEPGIWRSLALAGLAQTSFQLLLIQGIQHTTASISAILLATAPLLTAGWLALSGAERLAGRQWLGLGLGLIGVALVLGVQGDGGTPLGNAVAFLAAIAWAWYGLSIGPAARVVGSVRAACATVGIAALLLSPLGFGEAAAVDWGQVSPTGWGGLLYGATLGLVAATVLWVRSVERWGTQATMNYGYVEPVSAVVIASIVLGETLGPMQLLGAALALGGVYLASNPPSAPLEQTAGDKLRF